MPELETSPSSTSASDARRAARLAVIDAEQAHGEALLQRYGRVEVRPRFAVVNNVAFKRRMRRR